MKPRLLILTAGFGEGHNAAARAVASAADEQYGAGTACVSDVFALSAPRLNAVVRRGYLGLINRAPQLWRHAYRWFDRSTLFPRMLQQMRRETRLLGELVERENPTAICCTYPIYAFLLAGMARKGRLRVPFFNVVTDSISINSLWWRAGAARWFLPNEDTAEVLREVGLDPRKMLVTGFPVSSFFSANADTLSPTDLGSGATPRVLYIINSRTPRAEETARCLLSDTPWEITCTVGRNEALQRELEALASRRSTPAKILGWTDKIPTLLMTHHVVVSKAGGATTQEALAARCPMVVNQIVPGQEEGNYDLLRRHGIGTLAETPEAVVALLRAAFAHGGQTWREWRAAIVPLSRPDAARDIVSAMSEEPAACGLEPVPLPFQHRAASA